MVTNVGKKIASSAKLIPADYHKSHFAKFSGGSSHSDHSDSGSIHTESTGKQKKSSNQLRE